MDETGANAQEVPLSLTRSTNCAEPEYRKERKIPVYDRATGKELPSLHELWKRRTPAERQEALRKRAMSRFLAGSNFERLLLVTLTTPEDFQGSLHDAWRKFMWRCRRRGLFRRYFAVVEYNEAKTCKHLHVVFQVRSWLDIVALRRQWTAVCKAHTLAEHKNVWVYCEFVRKKGGTAKYLAKYLTKAYSETADRHRAYWYSLMWVFAGYCRFAKAVWALQSQRADHLLWQVRVGGEVVAHYLLLGIIGSTMLKGVLSVRCVEDGLAPYPMLRKEVGT